MTAFRSTVLRACANDSTSARGEAARRSRIASRAPAASISSTKYEQQKIYEQQLSSIIEIDTTLFSPYHLVSRSMSASRPRYQVLSLTLLAGNHFALRSAFALSHLTSPTLSLCNRVIFRPSLSHRRTFSILIREACIEGQGSPSMPPCFTSQSRARSPSSDDWLSSISRSYKRD